MTEGQPGEGHRVHARSVGQTHRRNTAVNQWIDRSVMRIAAPDLSAPCDLWIIGKRFDGRRLGINRLPSRAAFSSINHYIETRSAGPSTIIIGHPREQRSTRLSIP